MKIKQLEKDSAGRYDIADIPAKINEIIDFLNSSFITNDPDTVYVSPTITVDRLTPLVNEQTATIQLDNIEDATRGVGLFDGIKCPKCGAKYFTVGNSYSTCIYYPMIIKDGVNINPERNRLTTSYTCCECGHKWNE